MIEVLAIALRDMWIEAQPRINADLYDSWEETDNASREGWRRKAEALEERLEKAGLFLTFNDGSAP
jgi:hypothetical protein